MATKIIRSRNRKNGFAERVFDFLADKTIDLLNLGIDIVVDPLATDGGRHYTDIYRSKRINYFRTSPYFKEIKAKSGKNNKFCVTPKGRLKIIKRVLKNKMSKQAEWNGYWWAIAFDIPEKNKKARDLLRHELKHMGFAEIQKSIWVTPYDIEKELSVLLKFWLNDLGDNIRIFKIEKMINDKDIREQFNIG